jgi:hypothetical protein
MSRIIRVAMASVVALVAGLVAVGQANAQPSNSPAQYGKTERKYFQAVVGVKDGEPVIMTIGFNTQAMRATVDVSKLSEPAKPILVDFTLDSSNNLTLHYPNGASITFVLRNITDDGFELYYPNSGETIKFEAVRIRN